MISILAVVHIILSVFLVLLVLIQDPKGGSVGGMFGGGGASDSLFGATGAPTFLAQLTRWVAVVFAASCIAMTIFIKPKSDSVLDNLSVPASQAPGAEGTANENLPATTNQENPKTNQENPKETKENNNQKPQKEPKKPPTEN